MRKRKNAGKDRKKFILISLSIIFISVFAIIIVRNVSSTYEVYEAFPNLKFEEPTGIYSLPDSNELLVLEQQGFIYSFTNSRETKILNVFLDIYSKVFYQGEQGLLGLAFHPDYSGNKLFYVNYVADNPSRTVISQFKISAVGAVETILLEFEQPTEIHKGGQLAFGHDGYLYIGTGDGGVSSNAQDRTNLLGKILRIDVSVTPYSIPADNPFVGNQDGFREEIYAYGFRNPWRFSFDQVTGELWVGDVGNLLREEVDIVEAGKNYGWPIFEGNLKKTITSNEDEFEAPVFDYSHGVRLSAVTGGFVYYGQELESLRGKYIYGDYASGEIMCFKKSNRVNTILVDTTLQISSLGIDGQGELLVCAYQGEIYRIRAKALF
jgi:glucose/arabinose dehydrogenase